MNMNVRTIRRTSKVKGFKVLSHLFGAVQIIKTQLITQRLQSDLGRSKDLPLLHPRLSVIWSFVMSGE